MDLVAQHCRQGAQQGSWGRFELSSFEDPRAGPCACGRGGEGGALELEEGGQVGRRLPGARAAEEGRKTPGVLSDRLRGRRCRKYPFLRRERLGSVQLGGGGNRG